MSARQKNTACQQRFVAGSWVDFKAHVPPHPPRPPIISLAEPRVRVARWKRAEEIKNRDTVHKWRKKIQNTSVRWCHLPARVQLFVCNTGTQTTYLCKKLGNKRVPCRPYNAQAHARKKKKNTHLAAVHYADGRTPTARPKHNDTYVINEHAQIF